jgi:hypothetical protein
VEYHLDPAFTYKKMLSLKVHFYGATLTFEDKAHIDMNRLNREVMHAARDIRPGLSLILLPAEMNRTNVSTTSLGEGQVELKPFNEALDADGEKYILNITFDSYAYCMDGQCGHFHTSTSMRGHASIVNATTHESIWEATTNTERGKNPEPGDDCREGKFLVGLICELTNQVDEPELYSEETMAYFAAKDLFSSLPHLPCEEFSILQKLNNTWCWPGDKLNSPL